MLTWHEMMPYLEIARLGSNETPLKLEFAPVVAALRTIVVLLLFS